MRPIKLIWGIGGTLLVALLIDCNFYQRSNEMINIGSQPWIIALEPINVMVQG